MGRGEKVLIGTNTHRVVTLGGLWSLAWPAGPLSVFALVGGAAFLASSMKMPLTAIMIVFELTCAGRGFPIPVLLAVAGSLFIFHLCARHDAQNGAHFVSSFCAARLLSCGISFFLLRGSRSKR
jgi:hypothetical protein